MDIRRIDERLAVSPQISPTDLAGLKQQGFRAIICNRPDGEGADQPSFDEVRAEAEAVGIEARYLPVTPGVVRDEDAAAFGAALAELPGPVLAYCRTGTRSATLWALDQAKQKPLPEILAATTAAGYDMSGVTQRIVDCGKTATDTGDARSV